MRYKVGWFIPQQIMALTHLVPEVTQDDFGAIVNAINACLQEVSQPFYTIIDNRIIKSEQVVSLDVILQTLPQLQRSPLDQIIMILPRTIGHKAASMEKQQIGNIQLRYMDNLTAAFAALHTMDTSLNWDLQVANFFAEDITVPKDSR